MFSDTSRINFNIKFYNVEVNRKKMYLLQT